MKCCIMLALFAFLCILDSSLFARATDLNDLKIKVNTEVFATTCTGAGLAEYPPTFNGIESSKRLCHSPAVLHSKCNTDAISSFDSPAAGQCLYTFPDINEEQTFRFSGVSIVHSNGTDATVKVAVRIKAFLQRSFAGFEPLC